VPAIKLGCLAGVLALAVLQSGCGPQPVELGRADYSRLVLPAHCAPGDRPASAGQDDSLATSGGIRLGVRTPSNYDPTRAHPLLIVFAPASHGRVRSERFAGLTQEATARGLIVAYADHRPLSLATFEQLGEIAALLAKRWCVDEQRVYFAGHSDGGTAAAAVTFLRKSSLAPAGIVVSGAGIRRQDLDAYACPPPISVMVIHSREDELFPLPEFGSQPAQWWAACNRCTVEPRPGADGCVEYQGCASGTRTRYCEIAGDHTRWPGMNAATLAFLAGR
jgi:polyhydroxybutyrate depolymerase